MPVSVPGVEHRILNPRETWADRMDYDATAARLVKLFNDNFARFADDVDAGVLGAAPGGEAGASVQQAQESIITVA